MYEHFTDRARKVLQLANQESQRFNHEYIGTEHILLGLIKEGAGVAANVLKNLGLDFPMICQELEKLVKPAPGPELTSGKLPQTPRAKKVIEYAIKEARDLCHNYVGTEHLLLGLLREDEGVAAQVLRNFSLVLDQVRQEVLSLVGPSEDSYQTNLPSLTPRAVRDLIVRLYHNDENHPKIKELQQRILELTRRKERAVSDQNWEKAADFRDQAILLMKELHEEIRKYFNDSNRTT